MDRSRTTITFLNIGHAFDHLAMLIFPTVVLAMSGAFGRSYGELLPLSLGGFVAFGAGSLPSGWLGDRWSRWGMMLIFFIGIGVTSILTGLARSPLELALGLTLVGLFASIYHPVGIAMLVKDQARVGRTLGVNDAMVARYTDDEWRSRVYAVRYVVSFGASSLAVPLVAWLHGASGGFTTLFVVLAGVALATLGSALAFPANQQEVAPLPMAAE